MALLLAHSAARPTAPGISRRSGAASVVLAESATERILRSSRSLPKQLWLGRKAGDNERAPLQKRVVAEARAPTSTCWSAPSRSCPSGAPCLVDVPQVADYLRVSKASACKRIERQKISAIRTGRLLPVRKGEPGETLLAMGNDICSGILWPRPLHNK